MDARSLAFEPHDRATPTYYGRPAVKPSLYGWSVALYIYVSGLAAAVQIVVTAAQLLGVSGSASVSLIGRGIALAGAVLGGILLILDLHTKQRFYNMLRIFRPTSPMSIGTYALMGFGFFSLVAFVAQAFGFARLALVCASFASVIGWWMTTYTAALLSVTATPLWASVPKLLAIDFAASAFATGAATAGLAAWAISEPGLMRAFGNITAVALLVELVASIGAIAVRQPLQLNHPLQTWPWGPTYIVAVVIVGVCVPLLLYSAANAVPASADMLTLVASSCVLAGGFVMRGTMLLAGNDSATRPQDYFRLAAQSG